MRTIDPRMHPVEEGKIGIPRITREWGIIAAYETISIWVAVRQRTNLSKSPDLEIFARVYHGHWSALLGPAMARSLVGCSRLRKVGPRANNPSGVASRFASAIRICSHSLMVLKRTKSWREFIAIHEESKDDIMHHD